MLQEMTVLDTATYRSTGHIEVRTAHLILRDGVELARSFSRHVVEPGAGLENESPQVRAVAQALWTAELIAEHQARSSDPALPGN